MYPLLTHKYVSGVHIANLTRQRPVASSQPLHLCLKLADAPPHVHDGLDAGGVDVEIVGQSQHRAELLAVLGGHGVGAGGLPAVGHDVEREERLEALDLDGFPEEITVDDEVVQSSKVRE